MVPSVCNSAHLHVIILPVMLLQVSSETYQIAILYFSWTGFRRITGAFKQSLYIDTRYLSSVEMVIEACLYSFSDFYILALDLLDMTDFC